MDFSFYLIPINLTLNSHMCLVATVPDSTSLVTKAWVERIIVFLLICNQLFHFVIRRVVTRIK